MANYITLRPAGISQGHYKAYQHQRSNNYYGEQEANATFDANDWNHAVKDYLHTDDRKVISGIGGFYNRRKDTVNLPTDSSFGNAVHEATHRLSGGLAESTFHDFINEGITQVFADIILKDAGLPKATGHSYGPNVEAAQKLITKMDGIDVIAKAYLQNSMQAIQQVFLQLGLIPNLNTLPKSSDEDVLKAVNK